MNTALALYPPAPLRDAPPSLRLLPRPSADSPQSQEVAALKAENERLMAQVNELQAQLHTFVERAQREARLADPKITLGEIDGTRFGGDYARPSPRVMIKQGRFPGLSLF